MVVKEERDERANSILTDTGCRAVRMSLRKEMHEGGEAGERKLNSEEHF